MSIDTSCIVDYYESDVHWQEYDCPSCKGDFDVYPIPRPGASIRCVHCGETWDAGQHCETYTPGDDGFAICIDYPQRSAPL